jgi:hypothetical protein
MADKFYNRTVTIWNKYVDGLLETEIWLPTLIKNVRILVSRGNNIVTSGLESADSARLHISDSVSELGKPYKSASEWNKLVQTEKPNFFTLDSENDTFFVEGDTVALEPKDNFFDYMKRNYTNCFKVTSVDRFDIIPHWEVWGK